VVSDSLPPEDAQHVIDTLIGVICEEMGFSLQRQKPSITPPSNRTTCCWYYLQPLASESGQEAPPTHSEIPNLVLASHAAIPHPDDWQEYVTVGIPEVWWMEGNTLHFYQLENGGYVESDRSTTFPLVPVAEIPLFVEKAQKVGEQTVAKAFRAWSRMRIRENRGQSSPPPPPLPPLNPFS
jgi:hypothetical protein